MTFPLFRLFPKEAASVSNPFAGYMKFFGCVAQTCPTLAPHLSTGEVGLGDLEKGGEFSVLSYLWMLGILSGEGKDS